MANGRSEGNNFDILMNKTFMTSSKRITFLTTLTMIVMVSAFTMQTPKPTVPSKFHELKAGALDGKGTIDFAAFKGKKVLIVNTASECGYTPQYEQLQKLHEKFQNNLVVIGFPCNQFGGQEPGTAERIQEFCQRRWGVTFPLSEKVDVKGDNQHVVYQWLTQKKYNKAEDVTVRWNFGKFLIDENGKFMKYFPSQVSPLDDQITTLISAK
jgi:glutathione peroxidase